MRQLLLSVIFVIITTFYVFPQDSTATATDTLPRAIMANDEPPRLSRSLLRGRDTTLHFNREWEHLRRPWIAGVEVVATDVFFHVVTRYMVNEDYDSRSL